MKNVLLVLLMFLLLIAQTTFLAVPFVSAFAPNLLLPMALHLGVSPDVPAVRGAAVVFVCGYLLDSLAGSTLGLQTFLLVGTFLLARFAGLRLLMRGVMLEVILTFVVGIVHGGASLALRAIFEVPPPFPLTEVGAPAVRVGLSAALTAGVAPLVFALVRRVEGVQSMVRREEGV